MSNKMKKNIFIVLSFVILTKIFAFTPGSANFSNAYQYQMFKSWVKKNKKGNATSSFSKDFIFANFKGNKVIFAWENRKIYNQFENIYALSKRFGFVFPDKLINRTGEALFRLNCYDKSFFSDFISAYDVQFLYNDLSDSTGVDRFFADYSAKRFNAIKIEFNEKKVTLYDEENRLTLIFKDVVSEKHFVLSDIKPKLVDKKKTEREVKKEIKIKVEKEFIEEMKEVNVKDANIPFSSSNKLAIFLEKNYKRNFPLEILNNKISNPTRFLKDNFPDYRIIKKGNIYRMKTAKSENDFSAEIDLHLIRSDNGINFISLTNNTLKGSKIKFLNGESVDTSHLSRTEIESIAPFLSQLMYEHRAIGTKLFNFLLINDAVPSTLVLKEKTKKLYEFHSYSMLLKLLNNYWQGKKVYFNINDVKKVNGFIEFKTYLVAYDRNSGKKDMAEIRFQLSKDYKMKYIMMFLSEG